MTFTGKTMSDSAESSEEVQAVIEQLGQASMADSVGLLMQNAITIQHGMQTITNASVSSSCALILASVGG